MSLISYNLVTKLVSRNYVCVIYLCVCLYGCVCIYVGCGRDLYIYIFSKDRNQLFHVGLLRLMKQSSLDVTGFHKLESTFADVVWPGVRGTITRLSLNADNG